MNPLFGKFTYFPAPEGVTPGGGGAAPAADADPTPDPQDGGDPGEGGGDDDPPADDDPQDGEDPSRSAAPQRGRKDNPIPYSRVKEMLARARAEGRAESEGTIRQEFEGRFQSFMQKFEERFGHQPSREDQENAVRVLLGQKPLPGKADELNRPVTLRDMQAYFQAQNQQITQAFSIRREEAEVESALTGAKTSHAEFFEDDPELEDRLLDLYRASPEGISMRDVIAKEIKRLTTFAEKRTANYAKRKLAGGRIAPMGRGTAPRTATPKARDLSKPGEVDAAIDDLLDELAAEAG